MADSSIIGPARGSLVIIGGRETPEILERFVQLSGGSHAPIMIVPTADGSDDHPPAGQGSLFKSFTEVGAARLTLLHAKDRCEADSDTFIRPIKDAQGVYFCGGRQLHLADRYLGTKTEQALRDLLNRGGCIGGSSAGATIQGSYLVRGDSRGNLRMMGDHEKGFGFLKDVAIDQHLLKRNRHLDMIEVIRTKPELLGIGIDEETAIVVQGDQFSVIGRSYVAIYDHEKLSDQGRFYFLAPGDRFDLAARIAERPSDTMRELWLPQISRRLTVTSEYVGQYAGIYKADHQLIEIVIRGDRIFAKRDDESESEFIPVSEDVFYGEDWGEKITFGHSLDGGVESLSDERPSGTTVFRKTG